jgi:hypothetical protein
MAEARASIQSLDFEKVRVFTLQNQDSQLNRIRSQAELDSSKYDVIYNLLLRDEKVIAFVVIPFVESGDRKVVCSYYFGDDKRLIATKKRISFFDEACSDVAMVKTYTVYLDTYGKMVSDSTSLTNSDGLSIQNNECSQDVNYQCLEITSVDEIPFIATMAK